MSALVAEVAYRTCPKCEVDRPLGHFNKHKRQCKECRAAIQRKYYGTHRDRLVEEGRVRGRGPMGVNRRAKLREAYGASMTPERYDSMLAAQGGVCAICREDVARGDGAAGAVDHCHVTGEIRGILCAPCNVTLGMSKDDPDRLMAAIAYLARFQQH